MIDPQTPTEMALVNKIKKLERQIEIARHTHMLANNRDFEPVSMEVEPERLECPSIRLFPTVDLIANVNPLGIVDVMVTGQGMETEDRLRVQYRSEQRPMHRHVIANHMATLHWQCVRQIADLIQL